MRLCLALLLLGPLLGAFVTPAAGAADEPPAPGVSKSLAVARRADILDLRYDLRFAVPEAKSAPVTGTNVVRVRLAEGAETHPLVMDFDAPVASVTELVVNGRTVAPHVVNGHVVVSPAHLVAGDNRVDVAFVAGDGPLNRADDFLYTLFVPARAHRALPCFDQPDLKARVTLSLDLPAGWNALANGAERSRAERDGRVALTFAETAPLPTYLLAFAAGKLQVAAGERDGRTIRVFHRETDAAKLQRNLPVIFDLHAQALAWLERYTDVPYPWGKFDVFRVPAFQFGGMEHAGAIFYNAPPLLLEESASQAQLLGRASVIAHETAHIYQKAPIVMRQLERQLGEDAFRDGMRDAGRDSTDGRHLFPASMARRDPGWTSLADGRGDGARVPRGTYGLPAAIASDRPASGRRAVPGRGRAGVPGSVVFSCQFSGVSFQYSVFELITEN